MVQRDWVRGGWRNGGAPKTISHWAAFFGYHGGYSGQLGRCDLAQSREWGIGMTAVHIHHANGDIVPRIFRVPWKLKGAKWEADFSRLFFRRIWVRAYTVQSCEHGKLLRQWEIQLARWPTIK